MTFNLDHMSLGKVLSGVGNRYALTACVRCLTDNQSTACKVCCMARGIV